MLSTVRSAKARTFQRSSKNSILLLRRYSSHQNDHGHSQEHHDHDDHHELPLSEEEPIVNRSTIAGAAAIALGFGYYYANDNYKKNHDGKSLVSAFHSPNVWGQLEENFLAYRARVEKQRDITELLTMPQRRDHRASFIDNDGIPGRIFSQNANCEFNVIRDFSALPERRKPR
ncbi:hypothetical protein KL912_005291 [Ogataea haglerorum]|nr:hypothetical protein KL951_005159 [Ogataea haglerorum]KAG7744781.1 hypothetical protein KL912_005291 [Ogataea haglerorum]KAG7753660.1 hypothetical protein KL947_005192 [Ogataea haglerorum]